jgi:hypothetical protein
MLPIWRPAEPGRSDLDGSHIESSTGQRKSRRDRDATASAGRQLTMDLFPPDEEQEAGEPADPTGETLADLPIGGGFIGRQTVETIDGPLRIARLCEKRLGLQARTFDEGRGEWVYRPITSWQVARARVDDLLTVELVDKTCLYATRDLPAVLPDGRRRPLGELAPGDHLATWGLIPTGHQWDFMYGSLLGDASSTAVGFTCEHSIKQVEYVAWKQSVLSGLGAVTFDRKQRKVLPAIAGKLIHSAPSRIVRVGHRHVYEELRRACYGGPDEQKHVTEAWLARVGGLGVAAWVLDDGSITNRAKKRGKVHLSGNIATHGFLPADRQALADWLSRRYGRPCTVNCVGALCPSVNLLRALIDEVARWVPRPAIPKSKAFLARAVGRIQADRPVRPVESTCRLGLVPLRIKDIRPYRHDKPDIPEVNVYTLVVRETRTFCAGPVLVAGH